MKAEELRIGNYVKCVDGNTICIDKDDMIYILSNTFDVEPIPLSESVLLKCGFEKGGFNWFKLIYKNKGITFNIVSNMMCIESHYEGEKKSSIQILGLEPKHLHQLQNLCYALTGEELEVSI